MTQIAHIAEVEDGLIGLLTGGLDLNNIGTLSAEDFQDDDTIVTDTPAIRLFFSGEDLATVELKALLYDSKQSFIVLCGAQSLRGKDDERRGAYELVTQVCDVLAGARFDLPSHQQRPLVKLVRVKLMQSNENGTWYALEISVEHFHMFSGMAAV